MAGQQPDPWQSYSPPPADSQEAPDTYVFPQSAAQGPQGSQSAHGAQGAPGHEQAYARPAPGYPAPSYGIQDPPQDFGPPPQDYGYPGPQGIGQQWQATPGMPGASAARARGDATGFFGALFDFGFNSFVTPKIIKALYVLFTFWAVFWALIFMRLGFKYGGTTGGIFTLVVVDPIFLLLTLGVSRVILEYFMVTHRIHDELKAIRDRADERI